MKRFLLDALIIIMIVMIGISMDDSNLYKNKQESMDEFENEIKQENVVDNKETQVIVNQVNDNNASVFAIKISDFISFLIEGGISLSNDFFEIIVND